MHLILKANLRSEKEEFLGNMVWGMTTVSMKKLFQGEN